ncbi:MULTISPECIES: hypothetical protein [unclassified Myxococcus]|jgi:uncharacterized membrane protein YfcA|uniref:hypothetical protein n=1 Tax=Myxococcus TaxID=32 RepID=UPI001CBB038D|nr:MULTISPECIES: hypothetical protein [unclassified Myxococcus]MBZ4397070.1 hypothetical protein [Myxococcus sp. AS-1-15]MBZ4408203.1 hypothetical protein [Myxococcus sp. XM-1-1-1]BDT33300.1 hypothetical protein MFMH1_29690 [Myxococcus sp. MH1]
MSDAQAPLAALTVPLFALAQVPQEVSVSPEGATGHSYWYWVALLVLAAAVFAWVAVALARKRKAPPPRSTRATPRYRRPV